MSFRRAREIVGRYAGSIPVDLHSDAFIELAEKMETIPVIKKGMQEVGMNFLYEWHDPDKCGIQI